jgi:MFS family permease
VIVASSPLTYAACAAWACLSHEQLPLHENGEDSMNPVLAFTVIMAIWTVSDFLSKLSKGLVSSLFVASLIFLVGFLTGLFPPDLLTSSSLLAFAGVVVGFVIVHLGTVISIDDFIKQWRTVLTGIGAVAGIAAALFFVGSFFKGSDYVIAAIGAISGGTVSVVIIQEAALAVGLATVAVFPVLIAALQGLVGFPLTSVILRKEALRLRDEYRAGKLTPVQEEKAGVETKSRLPAAFQSTVGTLFVVGVTVYVARLISDFTNGNLNTFVVALILGVLLRWARIFKPSVLSGIDAYGLMITAVLILVFGPLATVTPADLKALALPLAIAFVVGVAGIVAASVLVGKLFGFTAAMSVGIGLTALYGFPGTLLLSQEAAKAVGETEEEVKAIEAEILPRMVVAGFATVTITSVIVTGIIAANIGN